MGVASTPLFGDRSGSPPFVETGENLRRGVRGGGALDRYKEAGWITAGVDISPEAVAKVKEKHVGYLGEVSTVQGEEEFDLIRLSHVLEHTRDPLETMRHVARLLRPNGLCMIACPNQGSALARIFKKWWWQIDAPRHFFHFTKRKIEDLCKDSGLELVMFFTQSSGAGIVNSLAFLVGDVVGRPFFLTHMGRPLYRTLSFLFVPVAVLFDWLNLGDSMILLLQKARDQGV